MIALLVDLEPRWRMHDDGGSGWVMALLMLLFLAALVVVVLVFVRGSTSTAAPGPGMPGHQPDARAILRERFARGEIDEQDFRSRMRSLDETG
ncbi:putative membrane protein [Marmoricola sp. URHA0025 HA25]